MTAPKNETDKLDAIREALAEADKGVFISAEAMHRWIESWGTPDELPPPEPDVFLPPKTRVRRTSKGQP